MLSYHTNNTNQTQANFQKTMSLLPQDIQLPKAPKPPSSPSSSSHMTKTFKEKRELEEAESDDDLFTVPDMDEANKTIDEATEKKTMNKEESSCSRGDGVVIPAKKKRGRNPVDKEYRRIKRLLRNRVSAQQARERKKVYVTELEWKEKELQDNNFQLEEKISTLVNENSMLRKILMNTRPKLDESADTKA